MSKVTEMAAHAKRLQADDTFQDVITQVKEDQTKIFLNARSTQEDLGNAHEIIRGLAKIEGVITSRIENGKFEQNRDQHRGSD